MNDDDDTIQPQLSVKATGKQLETPHQLPNKSRQQSIKANKLSASLTGGSIIPKTLTSPISISKKSAAMITGFSSTASTSSQFSEITGKYHVFFLCSIF